MFKEEKIIGKTILRYIRGKGARKENDLIIVENAYKTFVNDVFYNVFYCSPEYLEELVIGNLALNGKITSFEDIKDIEIESDKININLNSECRESIREEIANFKVYADDLLDLMGEHLAISEIHRLTGAVHIMSLADGERILVTREDIGRHNAVDKLYGYCLKNNVFLSDKILLSSGRITHEICYKAFKMGIRILVSRSAVSSMAIELAQTNNVTLVGFTRGERFNIYTCPERIITYR
ncbi:formate dehydrogenase accessory sulfurtransferase FdhD [Thermosyntropha sp.]|uniref:formate dehydrogenase accessory sulfurtransferase FdhD n=1 Tax=Thermosyntropha sp. TaxID=2740820 RepID=UPI0025D416C8|nr:formate dehydrogenase accessory sulfurtransferase FdhD [Thermosyntropha sp.]MBO8159126.1 formate dehydrogenase accessory sulfurtransferase FdhD [Thermosyntropha sp.]